MAAKRAKTQNRNRGHSQRNSGYLRRLSAATRAQRSGCIWRLNSAGSNGSGDVLLVAPSAAGFDLVDDDFAGVATGLGGSANVVGIRAGDAGMEAASGTMSRCSLPSELASACRAHSSKLR